MVLVILISLPISATIVFGTMYVARSGVVDGAVEMVVRVMDRARAKLGDKVTIPAVVEEIEHTTLGEINYKVVPLNTWFDADEIEALGQTESEDCISRQQTIEAFCDDCRGLKPVQCEHWDKCKSQKVLRSLPPVTPTEHKTTETMIVDGEPTEIDPLSYEVGYTHGQSERQKGEWKYGNGNGECPFCGRERQLGWDNFCGFCGADMRGDKE